MRELRRVIFNRTTLFMLLLLTVVGAVLFWLSITKSMVGDGYTDVYNDTYHELLDRYGELSYEDATQLLDEEAEESNLRSSVASFLRMFGEEALEELAEESPRSYEIYKNGSYKKYSGNIYLGQAEREAFEVLRGQLAYLEEFSSYYPTIKKYAARMQNTSIFGSDPNSFAYRNTIKTVEDFEPIDGAVGTLGDDRSITSIFADPIADYLMLLFMAVVGIVMLKERKSGLWQLVRSLPRGRERLAVSRIVTLLAAALLATLFIFGSRVVISYWRFDGLKYGGRLIQSIEGFNGITHPMSVNKFMLIYVGIKFICTFGAGLLLYLLLSAVKNTNIAIAITALVLAAEFALYSTVRDSSILVPFKYVNIFQLIVPKGFTVSYLNLNIFERPVNARVAVGIVMALLAVLAAVGIVLIHKFKHPSGKTNPLERVIDRFRKHTDRKVFMQETGKVLFAQRGIIIIALLVYLFCTFGDLPAPTVMSEQMSVRSYYVKYAGSVSEDTLDSIDEDTERVQQLMMSTTDSFARMAYQNTLDGLEYLRYDVEDIIARNASGEYSNEILLLPPYTYMIVFGSGSRDFEVNQGLKALLCICLITAGMYAYEKQSGMDRLLRTLPRGRSRLFTRKQLLTLAFSLLVFIAVYLPEIIAEADPTFYGGFDYFGYPIQGLDICRDWKLPISVGAMTVVFYLMRFAVIYLVGSAVGLLSNLTERVNSAMVLACGVLVVPACIVAMGVSDLFSYTALPSLWLSGALFYGEPVPVIVYVLLFIGAYAVNRIICCSKRTPGVSSNG